MNIYELIGLLKKSVLCFNNTGCTALNLWAAHSSRWNALKGINEKNVMQEIIQKNYKAVTNYTSFHTIFR